MKLFIILLFAISLYACEPSRPSYLQIFSEAQFSGMRTDLTGNITKLKLPSPLITNSIRVSTGNYTLFTSSNFEGEQFTVNSNGGPNEDGNYPTTSNWGLHGIIIIRSILANASNTTIVNSKNNVNSRGLKHHGRILLTDNREDDSVESNKGTSSQPESDESTSQNQGINSTQSNVNEAINKPTGSVPHTVAHSSSIKVNQSTTKEEADPSKAAPVLPKDSDEGLFSSMEGEPSEGAGRSQLSELGSSSAANGNDANKDSSLEGSSENEGLNSNSMGDMNSMSGENLGSQEGSDSNIEDEDKPIEGDDVNSGDDGVNSEDDGVDSADDGVNSEDDGVNSADDGVNSGDDGVNSADDGVDSADDGVDSADDGVNSGDDGVNSADDGVNSENEGLNSNSIENMDDVNSNIIDSNSE